MALSKYFYVPGNPEFISYEGKCWRRMTGQSLAGETLVPGIDADVHETLNECLGITDFYEIAELDATVKVAPGGVTIVDPTSEQDMDIFTLSDFSVIAVYQSPGKVLNLSTVMLTIPVFSITDVSAITTATNYTNKSSYNVFSANNLDPVADTANYLVGTQAYIDDIEPDILAFLSSLT